MSNELILAAAVVGGAAIACTKRGRAAIDKTIGVGEAVWQAGTARFHTPEAQHVAVNEVTQFPKQA